MRTYQILVLAISLLVEACADGSNLSTSGDPSSDGTLVVSTITAGGDPDRDGFQLTIDGLGSITLEPTDSAQVIIPAGRHALGLQGVAGQCSVDPGMPVDVDIASQKTTPVSFAVSCPAVGARVTTTTTGLDIDQDGYRVMVDGIDQAPIPSNAVGFFRSEPGSRTIALTGSRASCAFTSITRLSQYR